MNGMSDLFWLGGKSFLIALILTPIIRDISRSFNVVDRPGVRKVHVYPMPRVGGIAIAIAYVIALLSAGSGTADAAIMIPVWKLIPAASIVFFTGLLDDFFNLKPIFKIFGLLIAGSTAFWSGLHVGGLATHPLPLWIDFPLTLFWLLLTSNALNLIDGLDGLCAGMGLVSTLTLFAVAVIHGNHPLAYMTFPLAGALVGFLCYNVNPATVFLGDSGALLIGFLLGCYGMAWTQKTATLLSMLVPMLALSIPLLDVSLSVVRRFLRNQPIFSADRGHIHHRLLDRGLSARQAVLVLYLFGALAAAFALLASSPIGGKYQGFVILLFCGAAWLGIRQLRYTEFDIVGRLLRGELSRAMSSKLRLQRLSTVLEKPTSEDEWWAALTSEAAAFGMISLRWTGIHGIREQVWQEEEAPGWTLELPMSATDVIHASGSFAMASTQFDLIVFGELICRTFPGKTQAQVPQSNEAGARAATALP